MFSGCSRKNLALSVSHTYGLVSLPAAADAQEKQRKPPASKRKKAMPFLLLLKTNPWQAGLSKA